MIVRTARYSSSLDFLISNGILPQRAHRSIIVHGRFASVQCAQKTSLAASESIPSSFAPHHVTVPPSSQSVPTPGNVLTKLEQDLDISVKSLSSLLDPEAGLFNRAFQRFRVSLSKGMIAEATQAWTLLKKRNLLLFCGLVQYDMFSRSVVDYFKLVARHKCVLADEALMLNDVALFAAAGGATRGLTVIMLHNIKHEEPRKALSLYAQYLERLREKGLSWGGVSEEVEGHKPDSDEATSSPIHLSTASPIRDEVLLSAVTAHASLGTFHEALTMYLQATTRIAHFTLEEFLPSVPADLRPSLRYYFRRLHAALLLARPEALMKYLTNLRRDPAAGHLSRLYDAIVEGMTSADPWIAVSPDQLSERRMMALPDFFWPSFLKGFLAVRQLESASRLWDDMLKLGVVPSVVTWNALLDGYAAMRLVDKVLGTWDIMIRSGVQPDALSYRAVIHALNQAGNFAAARERLEAFERAFLKTGVALDDPAILAVYNTTLHDLLFKSLEGPANTLLDEMESKGVKPDIVTFNTFLRFYGRKGDLKGMAKVLQKLDAAGVKGDIFTFSTLLSGMVRVRPDADKMMLAFMKKQGIAPDTTSLTAIINQQLREHTPWNFKVAMDILSKMERNLYEGAEPNAITYTCVLTSINEGKWLDRDVVTETNRRVWETMNSRYIVPDRSAYNILLKTSLSNPAPEGLRDAMRYYRDMLAQRVHVGNETWWILLQGLKKRGELDIGSEVIQQMRNIKKDTLPGSLKRLVDDFSRDDDSRATNAYL